MSKITPETLQFNASYNDRIIPPFWGVANETIPSVQTYPIEDVINYADNVILMFQGATVITSTLAALSALFDNGVRSYIITSSYRADYQPYLARVNVHFSQLYGFGNFIMLVNNKGKNRLFIQKNNDGYIEFNWNNHLYHYFVYAFWHFDNSNYQLTKNTTSKILDAPEFVPTVPVNKEFLINNREYVFGKKVLIEFSKKAKKQLVICCNDIELIIELITSSSPKIEKNIYINKESYQKKLLEILETEKVSLRVVDDKIKPFLLSDDTIISIEQNDTTTLGIVNNKDTGVINYHIPTRFLEYNCETTLNKIKHMKIMFDMDNPKSTSEIKEVHQVQDICVLKLEQMKNREYPTKRYVEKGYNDYGFARNVEFNVTFEPESIKHSSPKDTLYNQWANFKTNLLDYTKKLNQVNEDAISESSKLSVTERFLNRLLGKKTNYTRISKDLEKVKERISSDQIKYVEFFDIVDKLNKTNQDLRNDKEDFENLIEENNQYKKFNDEKDSLTSRIENRKNEDKPISSDLFKKNNDLENLNAQIDKNEVSIKVLTERIEKLTKEQGIHSTNINDKDNYDLKIKKFLKEVEDLNLEISQIKKDRLLCVERMELRSIQLEEAVEMDQNEIQELVDNNADDEFSILKHDERLKEIDKDLSRIRSDIREYTTKVEKLKPSINLIIGIKSEIIDIKTQLKMLKEERNQLLLGQSILKKTVNDLSKKHEMLNNEIVKIQNQLDTQYNEFVYKPIVKSIKTDDAFASVIHSNKKKGKSTSVNTATKQSSFPVMMNREIIPPELPKVGILYFYQNKKWLGITDWDEYKSGITEAERLSATLVWAKE